MDILNTKLLECNNKFRINFDGGNLSSDAGALLLKEFICKVGFDKLIKRIFKTNDTALRIHKDDENLAQIILQIICGYFEDDCADELSSDPILTAVLGKKNLLRSQPYQGSLTEWMMTHSGSSIIFSMKCEKLYMPLRIPTSSYSIWIPLFLIPIGIRKAL